MSATGAFVVAWAANGRDGAEGGIFARRFNSGGVAQGIEFQVNTYTQGDQGAPVVDLGVHGDFVIAWSSGGGQDGNGSGVFARRFDAAGVGLGVELQVNSFTTGAQSGPTVGMDVDGDFVVAWQSFGQDGPNFGVFARRFNAAGVGLGAELQANTYTTGAQRSPTIGVDADGDFVVAWESLGQDGYTGGVFARRFNSAGGGLGTEFQVNAYTSLNQSFPALSMSANGDFVVAWASSAQDGSLLGVFAQRFTTLSVVDIDGNGSFAALTDGLLILRFLFGFTGATLVSGVVDAAGCTRCDAPAIES